jgi:hypothetical protein
METNTGSFTLDTSNEEFNQALEFIKHTKNLVYLTGKAGTGKTTFLKHLRDTTTKNMVVLAPTGMAAVNAGGVTIHSFFGIPPSLYVPDDKRLRETAPPEDNDKINIYEHFRYKRNRVGLLYGLELLVIDEVSMVRCDLLDVVDRLLRVYRKRRDEPFGGVQVVLIGDAFQLPPVAKPEDWSILGQFYRGPFFFNAKVFEVQKPIYLELKKIYRQKEKDFISLLNRVRVNEVGEAEIKALNERYDPNFNPPVNAGYIILGTHNAQVERTNEEKLQELDAPLYEFNAEIKDDFPVNHYPADTNLRLKVGAQVMCLVNEKESGLYNGTIGSVEKLGEDKVVISLANGHRATIEKNTWQYKRYEWDQEEARIKEVVLGTFTQYPLRLAWAITVHKSQGQTFEKVIADVGSAFASGHVYVALSRCTTLIGLVLRTPIPRSAIKTDPEVLRFSKEETPQTLVVEQLNSGKADGHYAAARSAFKAGRFQNAQQELMQAVKYRNDIGTELFDRFCLVHMQRLGQWKERHHGLSIQYGELSARSIEQEANSRKLLAEMERITTKLDRSTSELKTSKKKGLELTKALEAERKEVAMLNEKIMEGFNTEERLTAEVEDFREVFYKLRNEINELKQQRIQQMRTIKEQASTILQSSNRVAQLEKELNRIRNLSWLDRLMGEK